MNPTDVVDGSYELISFAAGGEPAWPDFRSLFTDPCVPGLRVFPDDAAITVMDLDAYMVHQMREGLSDEGYSESPGERSTTIVGDCAVVQQQFFMRFRDREPVAAFDVYSLARIDGTWKIVSIISDMESDAR